MFFPRETKKYQEKVEITQMIALTPSEMADMAAMKREIRSVPECARASVVLCISCVIVMSSTALHGFQRPLC